MTNEISIEDISINDLAVTERFSDDCIAFCRKQGINSLVSLIQYFLVEENLDVIELMNSDVRNELKSLCKKHLDQYPVPPESDISLQQLSIVEGMSQRSYNVCKYNGLNSLKKILKAEKNASVFFRYRNSGRKSNEELQRICKKYSHFLSYMDLREAKSEDEAPIPVIQVEDLELNTLAELENMSARGYNVCKNAGLDSLPKMVQYFNDNKRHGFLFLRDSGKKTNAELTRICLKYTKPIKSKDLINIKKDGSIIVEGHNSPFDDLVNSLMLKAADHLTVKELFAGLESIPLFSLLNYLINCHYAFNNEASTIIFKKTFNCYSPLTKCTNAEVGKIVGLTRERVRQIRESIHKQLLYPSFGFIKSTIRTVFSEYISPDELPVICVSDEDAERINRAENTSFSPLFISLIFSRLYSESYYLLGNQKTLSGNKIFKEDLPLKHLYLVRRRLGLQFQFEKFLIYLTEIARQRREEDELITYSDLIEGFRSGNEANVQALINVMNTIAITDFGDKVEPKENGLCFLRNKEKSHLSKLIDILNASTTPLHYSEIHKQLVSRYSNPLTLQSLHQLLIAENTVFGLKGPGIYDLRSKGGLFGTIGDVAQQLLEIEDGPFHIRKLEKQICKELMVSKESVSTMLFNYNLEKRFIRDFDGMVRLRKWSK